jgi:hypothetical protein
MRFTAGKFLPCLAWLVCAAPFVAAQGTPSAGKPQQRARGVVVERVWKEFSPEGGGFALMMPGTPTEDSDVVETKIGKITNRMFALEDGGRVYIASYGEFPLPVTDPSIIKRMLDRGRDQALSQSKTRLVSERELTLGENLGREVVAEADNALIRARFYWVRQRLYQTVVMTPSKRSPAAVKTDESAAAKFFDSFKLKDGIVK